MPNCRRVETTRPHLEPRRERSSVRSSSVLSTGWEGSGRRARSPDDPHMRRIERGPDPPPRRGRAIRPRPPHEPGQGRSSWSLKKVAKGTPKDPQGSPKAPGVSRPSRRSKPRGCPGPEWTQKARFRPPIPDDPGDWGIAHQPRARGRTRRGEDAEELGGRSRPIGRDSHGRRRGTGDDRASIPSPSRKSLL
jgi:hypothetical protein